ncbi:MAG: chromosome segregation protein SMC [Proteobacteria bacterium]|nr:chromosome segregation protein SMC [Pseudomonadota bacterium]
MVKVLISGFKSFKDKTVVEVPSNIVAVVGPNGCGKSNIVDAIKWALGEQNPKYLRGKHMEDVIFAGTSEFPPVGMAEVSLFFQRTDTPFPEPYSSLNELVITRRLYRSGESEYLINKSPCRLKDIHDITIDTGLGQRFYGLIEQGMIESFMNYKPEEKRLIFEEVAGTAKYRLRKKATVQKLEASKLNLERVEDIISEVKSRRDDLEREAKRAIEYKKIFDELKTIELFVNSETYKKQKDLLDSKKREYEVLEKEINDREIELNSLSTRLEINKNELFFLEQEDSNISKALNQLGEEKNRIEKEFLTLKEGKTFRVQKINELNQEIEKINSKIQTQLSEIDSLSKILIGKENDIKVKESVLKDKEKLEFELRQEIKNLENTINRLNRELINEKNQIAFLSSQISYEEKSYNEALNKLEILRQELIEVDREYETLKSEIEDVRRQSEIVKNEKVNIENKIRELNDKMVSCKKTASELRKKLNEVSLKRERITGSYNSIKKMLEEYKGLSSGTQQVLKNFKKDGVFGTIIEKIDVDQNFMTPFENFLKDRLEMILVENKETAVGIIDFLKTNRLGACNILSLDIIDKHNHSLNTKIKEYIKSEGETESVLGLLFQNVEVVEDLNEALSNFEQGNRKIFITKDGEVVDERGIIFGGSRDKHNPYMVEKSRLRDIEHELSLMEKELKDLQIQINDRESEIRSLDNSILELKSDLENINIEISEHNIEIKHKEEELKRKITKKEQISLEIKNLELNCATYERKREELEVKLKSLNEQVILKEKMLSEKSSEIELKRNELDGIVKSLTELRVSLAEEKRSYHYTKESMEKANTDLENLNRKSKELTEESSVLVKLDLEAEQKLEKWKKELEDLQRNEKDIFEKKRVLESKLEDLRVKVRDDEVKLSTVRTELDKMRKSLMNMKDKITELSLKLDNVVERIKEKYFVDISISFNDYFSMNIERDKCGSEYIESLKRKLADMGEVNLLSIDEFEEVNKRYEFLCQQKKDLETSIDSLNKAIERINNVSLELFTSALKNIEANFDKLFKRLFGGGKAKIVLTEESNPLESGIDISVELPHKKFQSINLLSGGEKALVTLALIFAFYMQKPSPFCILDEVDAPLDDANVLKFRELLSEMSKFSQFLVVTHNKIVMENAGVLLGVTMETPGVSKIVAVKTHKEIL